MTEANFSVVGSMAFLYLALIFIQELKLYLLIICHAERIADITSSVKNKRRKDNHKAVLFEMFHSLFRHAT